MFDKNKIEQIIKDLWENSAQNEIAKVLNTHYGFTTSYGKKWTQANISHYALKVLGLPRKNKEFTKNSVAQKVESVLTPEVKTEKLTEVKELNPLQARYKNYFEEENKTALIETAIFEKEGSFFTDSLKIAQIFDKEHKNILRDIENLKTFDELNFEPTTYFDSLGRLQPKYNLTKDGFSLLVMGFTGDTAIKFKIAFIKKFNELEKLVQQQKQELITDPLIILAKSIDAIRQTREEMTQIKSELIQTTNKVLFFEKRSREAEEQLSLLPDPKVLPLQRSDRTNFNELVKKYSFSNALLIDNVYNGVYKEFGLRYHMDVEARAKRDKVSKIDYIESIGKIPELYALAHELFQIKKVGS